MMLSHYCEWVMRTKGLEVSIDDTAIVITILSFFHLNYWSKSNSKIYFHHKNLQTQGRFSGVDVISVYRLSRLRVERSVCIRCEQLMVRTERFVAKWGWGWSSGRGADRYCFPRREINIITWIAIRGIGRQLN